MKYTKTISLLLFFAISLQLHSNEQQTSEVDFLRSLAMTLAQGQNQSVHVQTSQQTHTDATNIAVQETNQETNIINTIVQQAGRNYEEQKDRLIDFVTENKYKIIASSSLAGYVYLLYKIRQYQNTFSSSNSWSSWKPLIDTAQLITLPHEDIYQELIVDIQKRYTVQQNRAEFSIPLTLFIEEINKEIYSIKQYIFLHNLIMRTHLKRFFFINEETIVKTKERLQRIEFLYTIFINWYTKIHMN